MQRISKLKEVLGSDNITIVGHDNIDVDAVISGLLLSRLLNYLQINNKFLILEQLENNESVEIVKEVLNIDITQYCTVQEDDSRKLILEDYYKTSHEGEVVACIDHHPTKEVVDYPFYYSRRSCSTSYMVYELMQEAGYEVSQEEAKMILFSMMIDTVSFRSSKTVEAEVMKAKEIAKEYNLDYEKLERYCLCLTPIDDMSVDEIVNNGYKNYNYSGYKVKSSYLQLYGMPEQALIDEWIELIKKSLLNECLTMWVFIIFDCDANNTFEYRITQKDEVLVEHVGILSRGTDIMPKIEEFFN